MPRPRGRAAPAPRASRGRRRGPVKDGAPRRVQRRRAQRRWARVDGPVSRARIAASAALPATTSVLRTVAKRASRWVFCPLIATRAHRHGHGLRRQAHQWSDCHCRHGRASQSGCAHPEPACSNCTNIIACCVCLPLYRRGGIIKSSCNDRQTHRATVRHATLGTSGQPTSVSSSNARGSGRRQ